MDKGKSSGIGIFGVCLIVFIILKLTNLINWSWFWVLSPIWIPVALVIFIILLISVINIFIKR